MPEAAGLIGHGVDLVEVARVGELLERHGSRFLQRCFSEAEQAYAEAHPRRRIEHYAARFAVKEAAAKALGTGISGGITFTDFCVQREVSGQPTLLVSGVAAELAAQRGIADWWVSISHTGRHAMASVIASRG